MGEAEEHQAEEEVATREQRLDTPRQATVLMNDQSRLVQQRWSIGETEADERPIRLIEFDIGSVLADRNAANTNGDATDFAATHAARHDTPVNRKRAPSLLRLWEPGS